MGEQRNVDGRPCKYKAVLRSVKGAWLCRSMLNMSPMLHSSIVEYYKPVIYLHSLSSKFRRLQSLLLSRPGLEQEDCASESQYYWVFYVVVAR